MRVVFNPIFIAANVSILGVMEYFNHCLLLPLVCPSVFKFVTSWITKMAPCFIVLVNSTHKIESVRPIVESPVPSAATT